MGKIQKLGVATLSMPRHSECLQTSWPGLWIVKRLLISVVLWCGSNAYNEFNTIGEFMDRPVASWCVNWITRTAVLVSVLVLLCVLWLNWEVGGVCPLGPFIAFSFCYFETDASPKIKVELLKAKRDDLHFLILPHAVGESWPFPGKWAFTAACPQWPRRQRAWRRVWYPNFPWE